MPVQPDAFDEFLRRVDPLMPLYQSLEFACVAGSREDRWILISGKAILSTVRCGSEAQIRPLFPPFHEIVALRGRIRAETLNTLVANLRDSWVVKGLERGNVQLTAEGMGGYSWRRPGVSPVDKSWNASSPWSKAFALYGDGPDISSLLSYSILQEVDIQLRKWKPKGFKNFDALCSSLELPARRDNLRSSFYLSAELPARFLNVPPDSAEGSTAIEVEYVGGPDLLVEWLPQQELETIPLAGKPDSIPVRQRVPLLAPSGAAKANLILSFAGLDADNRTVNVGQQKPRTPDSLPVNGATRKGERRKSTGKTAGEGGQAQIVLVEDTTKEFQGVWTKKRLKNNTDPKRLAMFETEVRAVQSINHPNVLKVVDSDLSADRPYFVAEYCERGSLQKVGAAAYRGNMRATLAVVMPILDALVAAHKAKVFHRDVKPPNILFRGDGSPVIGDFGICFREGEEHFTLSNDAMGSINFIAPEMESGQHGLGEPSNRTDVYSLGKVIYWMLSGGRVFAREDFPSLVDLLSDQRFEHVHRLLEEMVVRDPAKRIQSHEVKEKLEMTASLVGGDFAPLSPSIGLRCRFCGLGKYERFAAFDAGDASKMRLYPGGIFRLGLLPSGDSTNVRCLRCSHCGHVEWFQVTGIKNPSWWDK